jgi:serine protease Do
VALVTLALVATGGVVIAAVLPRGEKQRPPPRSSRASPPLTREQLIALAARGTVRIHVRYGNDIAVGTGIVVDKSGSILTASHAVAGASSLQVSHGTDIVGAHMLADAPCDDLALIQPDSSLPGTAPLSLAGGSGPRPGESVTALGYPEPTPPPKTTAGALHIELKQSQGTIRGIRDEARLGPDLPAYPRLIRHTAPLRKGESGGPLLNRSGQAEGINVASTNQATSYAIPAAWITTRLVPGAHAGLRGLASPGVLLKTARRRTIRRALNLDIAPFSWGMVVLNVAPGSPAEKARLGRRDVIVRAGGEPLESLSDLCRNLAAAQSSGTLRVYVVNRDAPRGEWRELSLARP